MNLVDTIIATLCDNFNYPEASITRVSKQSESSFDVWIREVPNKTAKKYTVTVCQD